LLGEGELHPQADQPLLAAVMQIAFDAAPFGIRDIREARPRIAQLAGMGAELCFEPVLREGSPRASSPGGPDGGEPEAERERHPPGAVSTGRHTSSADDACHRQDDGPGVVPRAPTPKRDGDTPQTGGRLGG
jgi:hypothetical protein